MVNTLPRPQRPLTNTPTWWTWRRRSPGGPWPWYRVYHKGEHTPDGVTHRTFGPRLRLDHHTGDFKAPAVCLDGRSVLYVARNLSVALGEVFGERNIARICPNHRVALVEPTTDLHLVDLNSQGACMRIGALPSLGTGAYARRRTQAWARALWEDTAPPAQAHPHGAYYQAAYSGGRSLALWNTDGQVATVLGAAGIPQDFALHDIWNRVVVALDALGLAAEQRDTCACRH